MPILLFLLTIPPLFLSSSQATNQRFSDCAPVPFSCGNLNLNISYPFLVDKRPSYCGYDGFHLTCDYSADPKLIIFIKSQSFQVLDVDYKNNFLTVVDLAVARESCPQSYKNTSLDFSLFDYTEFDRNLTLYINCTGSPNSIQTFYEIACSLGAFGGRSYYKLDNSTVTDVYGVCSSTGVVPLNQTVADMLVNNRSGMNFSEAVRAGFTVRWLPGSGWCDDCIISGGRCGYNVNNPQERTCICSDTTVDGTCFSHLKGGKKKTGIIIGAVLGVAGMFMICCLWWLCSRRTSQQHTSSTLLFSCWHNRTSEDQTIEAFLQKHGTLPPKRYNYLEVKRMTKSFHQKLGEGGFGSVFKGTLADGHAVAVKLLKDTKLGDGEEFLNEVASIGRTSHINIVSFLGFCFQGSKRALIYDFMPNGSLEKYIYAEDPKTILGWEKLFQIAIGIARGLEYLHRGCNTRIVHFDIKPHNILLDEDFCPKIADFGLAKLGTHKESILSMAGARGTVGFIAPEVFSRNFGAVSTKSDVYSYGMMLLEMAGGRRNVKVIADRTSEIYFPHWIYDHLDQDEWLQYCIVTFDTQEIARKLIIVGLWCIQTRPECRPAMGQVVEMLQGSITDLKIPPKPYLSSPPRSPSTCSMTL